MNTTDITANAADITLIRPQAGAGTPAFCNLWPAGKQALQALQTIIKNPIAKGAIGIVIAAGDAVASQICGATGEN